MQARENSFFCSEFTFCCQRLMFPGEITKIVFGCKENQTELHVIVGIECFRLKFFC